MTSEAVEMSEQVPLKSDTDNKDTEGAETQGEETPAKAGHKFKINKFWAKKPKDGAAMPEDTKPAAETAVDAPTDGDAAAKKKAWKPTWLKKPTCGGGGDGKPCPYDVYVNLEHRDEHNTNEHLKLDFADIIAEPDGLHSFDCVWRLTARTFTFVRSIVYKLLALVFFLPIAIIAGLLFALVTFFNVWLATPIARVLTVPALWIAKAWNFLVRSILDPLFRSCGLCFSSIHMRRYGFSNDATVEIA